MSQIPFNTPRAAKQGDTVPLDGRSQLLVEWDSRVPVDLTVTGPSGRSGRVRLEPQATVAVDPAPQRTSVALWHEVTDAGQPATGKVDYEMQNGAKVTGVEVNLATLT
jgi:hypothetical protein